MLDLLPTAHFEESGWAHPIYFYRTATYFKHLLEQGISDMPLHAHGKRAQCSLELLKRRTLLTRLEPQWVATLLLVNHPQKLPQQRPQERSASIVQATTFRPNARKIRGAWKETKEPHFADFRLKLLHRCAAREGPTPQAILLESFLPRTNLKNLIR